MGTAERRDRERQEVREKILAAARELFVAEGYEAVTVRKIAEQIEYAPAIIYTHFKDKQALLSELCNTDYQEIAHDFRRLLLMPDPVERLCQLGYVYVDFALAHPNHYRLTFMMTLPRESYEPTMTKGDPVEDGYAALLWTVMEGIEQKRFRREYQDAQATAQLCWSAMHGVVALYLARSESAWLDWRPPRDVARLMVDTVIRAMVLERT